MTAPHEQLPQLPPLSASDRAQLAYLDRIHGLGSMLHGAVARIEREGFTTEQAATIVATTFGWSAPTGGTSGTR